MAGVFKNLAKKLIQTLGRESEAEKTESNNDEATRLPRRKEKVEIDNSYRGNGNLPRAQALAALSQVQQEEITEVARKLKYLLSDIFTGSFSTPVMYSARELVAVLGEEGYTASH